MGLDHSLSVETDGEMMEIVRWRKKNWIHGYFEEVITNGEGEIANCEYHSIDWDVVRGLIEKMKKALDQRNPSHLEPKPGFFFGSTEVDDYYWDSLQGDLNHLEMLDTIMGSPVKEKVHYWAWW